MLILTIILAAFAPLMTKRKTVDLSSPWRYATNNSDIYYGLGNKQSAMIGQTQKATVDNNAKLIINTNTELENGVSHIPSISLKQQQYKVADLYGTLSDDFSSSLMFGGPFKNINSCDNTVFGVGAFAEGSGCDNVAMGLRALSSNGASHNTAVGYYALGDNTTGSDNTAVGTSVLLRNTTGTANTAVGTYALSAAEIVDNNSALGYKALYSNSSGSNNTAIGSNALIESKGSNNTAIGYNACANEKSHSYITCIGANSGPESDDGIRAAGAEGSSTTYIGTKDGIVVIPGMLYVEGALIVNNTMAVGKRDSSAISLNLPGRSSAHSIRFGDQAVKENATSPIGDLRSMITSDKRLKNIKSENETGLEKIRELKVFDYTFKTDVDKTPQVGVIAQDLQKVFPDAVKKGDDGYLKIRWDDMFYAVINSIKQLDTMVQDLVNDLKTVLTKVSNHDDEIQKLREENAELKSRLEKLEKAVF